MRARRRWVGLLTGCCALVAAAPAAGSPAGAAPGPAAAQATGSDLFVQTTRRGSLRRVPGRDDTFRLVFRSVHRDVTVFTDRPQRRAGSESLATFLERWESRGFDADPPNAALVLAGAHESRDVVVLELSRPRRGPRSVRYRARVIPGGTTPGLARFADRADARVGARFGHASLFIDSAPAGSLSPVRLTVNIPQVDTSATSPLTVLFGTGAGPTAQIDLDDTNPFTVSSPGPIALAIGEGGAGFTASSSSGASATVQLRVLPLRDPIVGTVSSNAADRVTIQTPSGATFPVRNARFSIPVDAG